MVRSIKKILNRSKRATLVYVILIIWVFFGVYGINKGADLFGLAAYFSAFAIKFGVYIWGETTRPSVKHDGINQ